MQREGSDEPAGHPLSLTGERTLPGIASENYWFRRHEAAYRFVCGRLPAGASVLDAGCGEGYGAAVRGAAGARVTAAGVDAPAAEQAAAKYTALAARPGCACPL